MAEHRRPAESPKHSVVDATVLSDAEKAKSLVAGASLAALGTLRTGAPFVSHVVGAAQSDGSVLFLFSELAEHTQALASDTRASLLFVDAALDGDASAVARVTLQGACVRVADTERAECTRIYVASRPHAAHVSTFADFRPYRFELDAIRWIGGFGRAAWLDLAAYRAARVDPLAAARSTVIPRLEAHRNEVLAAVRLKFGDSTDTTGAQILAVDSRGIDVLLRVPAPRAVRIPLPPDLAAALEHP